MKRFAIFVTLVLIAGSSCGNAQMTRVDPWPFGASSFYDVVSLGSSTALVGGEGMILRTENGGRSWQVAVKTDESVNRIVFLSATAGVAVTSDGAIYTTATAGREWVRRGTNVSQMLLDAAYVDGNNIVATGSRGMILRSVDAGATWTVDSLDADRYLYDIDRTSSGALMIGASGGVMFISDDGGQSWRSRSTGLDLNFNAIHFLDTSRGWAAGSGGIYYTSDAGETWTHQLAGESIQHLHFVSPTLGYASAARGGVFVTNDGSTWSAVSVGDSAAVFATAPTDDGIVAVGELGYIARSSGNGTSWQQTGAWNREHLFAIDFADGLQGYAVGERGIVLRTTDGGFSWTELRVQGEPGLSAVATDDGGKVWVGGANGAVYRSDNGGQSWTALQVANLAGVAELSHAGGATLWASGRGGLFVSTNGGESWEQRHVDASRFFYAVSAVGESVVAVADSGVAIRSTDGGASWQVLATSTSANLYDCAMINTLATLVGDAGTVLNVDLTSGAVSRVEVDSLSESLWSVLPDLAMLSTTSGSFYEFVPGRGWRGVSTGLAARGLAQNGMMIYAAGAAGSIWQMFRPSGLVPSLAASSSLAIAPNPAGDVFDVVFPSSSGTSRSLRVTDVNGRVVRSLSVEGERTRLTTSDLPAGVYVVELIARDGNVEARGRAVVVR